MTERGGSNEPGEADETGPFPETGEPDKETLQTELDQIKRAVGLHEEHPYWWRWWLVEGVGVGIFFPLFNVGFLEGFSYPLIGAIVAVFAGHQYVLWRIQQSYERPTTGVPSWGIWHLIVFAGISALIVGLYPILDTIEGLGETPFLWVCLGTVLGVAYGYMGQLLAAYGIRRADCYAFYAGGAWILLVSAALPWVATIEGWEFATFGIAYALYCVTAYVVLARL